MNRTKPGDGPIRNRPPLIIDVAQYHRLAELALGEQQETARQLLDEIERADLRTADEIPGDVVTIGAEVTYVDTRTRQPRTITLSYPHEADIGAGRISVLTPVGAALLGLSVGQTIEWAMPDGDATELTVVSVRTEPSREKAG